VSTPEKPTVSADFVASVMAKLAARQARPAPPVQMVQRPHHDAAAVLARYDPKKLTPLRDAGAPPDDTQTGVDALLADSTQIAEPRGGWSWSLNPDVRIGILRRLREQGHIAAALACNPGRPEVPVDRMLRAYLEGQPPALASLSPEELAAAREVTDWLRAAGFADLPTRDEIISRFEWQALLKPFEYMAGEHFGGRIAELATLREYADVLPPSTRIRSAVASVRAVFNWLEKPPLVISGPGGVGKSSLVARFILEHARAHEADRFPFCYLDFDRPEVAYDQPVTLLVEAVRQLGVQYPAAREQCEALRHAWLEPFAPARAGDRRSVERARSTLTPSRLADVQAGAARDFAVLLGSLGAIDRPVVFVLDTFEEVQRRSEDYVARIWHLLDDLRAAIPRLRVVVAGRADVPGQRTQSLRLAGLDREAAVSYLMARGIHDRAAAERIAGQLNGSPLSLKLAVDVLAREGATRKGELDIATREYLFLRVDDAVIQQQLYKRILDYVQDAEVRKLAHPGLVLRTLTPELILNVLREPCGLTNVTTIEAAHDLFRRIRREVGLVEVVDDNTVRHRADLRALMVPLVRQSEASKAHDIDTRAVAYFAAIETRAARAEEIYHRLWLNESLESISARWQSGIETALASALGEFTGARKAYLAARLGAEVDDATRHEAELEDWEQLTDRKAAVLLDGNDAAGALALLRARTGRSATSPLPMLEARALVALDRGAEALAVLDAATETAIVAGHRQHALALATTAAGVAVRCELREAAPRYRRRLQAFAQASDGPLQKLAIAVPSLAMANLEPGSRKVIEDHYSAFAHAFDAATDEELRANGELVLFAACLLREPRRLARAITLAPGIRLRPADLRTLAGELARFDASLTSGGPEAPGVLARRFHLPIRATLTETWSDFVVDGKPDIVRGALVEILTEFEQPIPPSLVQAVRRLPGFALGLEPERQETGDAPPGHSAGPGTTAPPGSRGTSSHTAAQQSQLATALAHAFPSGAALSEFLLLRLERRLEAIVSPREPISRLVAAVVLTASRDGWLTELVAAALDARPLDRDLTAIAPQFGIEITGRIEYQGLGKLSTIDLEEWQQRFRLIRNQVCSIEIAGSPAGTGFLIGPDRLLTASHVMESVLSGRSQPRDVVARFDVTTDTEGKAVSSGTPFTLASDWMISVSRDDDEAGLGHALLLLREAAGDQPIGGATLERVASLRRWIELPRSVTEPGPGDALVVVHHPRGKPLKISMNENAVRGVSPDRSRLFYDIDTEAGSSGAPCFSPDLELVAMHLGRGGAGAPSRRTAYGTLIGAIQKRVGRSGPGGDEDYMAFV